MLLAGGTLRTALDAPDHELKYPTAVRWSSHRRSPVVIHAGPLDPPTSRADRDRSSDRVFANALVGQAGRRRGHEDALLCEAWSLEILSCLPPLALGRPILDASRGRGTAGTRQRGPSRGAPGTPRPSARAPRQVSSHPFVALVLDRLRDSAASRKLDHAMLGPLEPFALGRPPSLRDHTRTSTPAVAAGPPSSDSADPAAGSPGTRRPPTRGP